MSYLGIDPSLRAYKQALFRATGGETTLPIDIDVEALVIKNGSLLIPDNDYYISDSNRIVVSKPALPGDEYFVINLSTFSFDGMATKKDLQDAIAGTEQQPLFFVMWWPKRSTIPVGFVPADGQLELRTTYKEAANQIDLGAIPFVTEADWLADSKLRASYTKGDGTTNFRMPDYNGKSQGGSAAVVLRGDGLNADPAGSIQGDAIRNITGHFSPHSTRGLLSDTDSQASHGAFYRLPVLLEGSSTATSPDGVQRGVVGFDASRVVPTASENRMVNTAGCWCVRLAHKVVATGVLDANGVVQSVNNHSMQIAEIESKLADVTTDVEKLNDKPMLSLISNEEHKYSAPNEIYFPKFATALIDDGFHYQKDIGTVTIPKSGVYKIQYSLTFQVPSPSSTPTKSNATCGVSVNAEYYTLFANYFAANTTSAVIATTSGEIILRLARGDKLQFDVRAVNGTTVRLWSPGQFNCEFLKD